MPEGRQEATLKLAALRGQKALFLQDLSAGAEQRAVGGMVRVVESIDDFMRQRRTSLDGTRERRVILDVVEQLESCQRELCDM